MLQEIRDLGFEYAELSHGIRISLLPGIFDMVDRGAIRISTVHNFCPLPIGVTHAAPNIFQFSSNEERERENAYRHSLKTIETAARVGARLVVLHLGSIDLNDYTDKLLEMVGKGLKDTPKFQKLMAEMEEKRDAKKEAYILRSTEMLKRLVEPAKNAGVELGVEIREALEEIPLDPDFDFLFWEVSDPLVGYWHDLGHAQIKENLGVINHAAHLKSQAKRLKGFHIHDVEFPGRDHRPPGRGMIDYLALKPMVKPEHLKVFEFSPSASTEEVLQGVEHLKRCWDLQ